MTNFHCAPEGSNSNTSVWCEMSRRKIRSCVVVVFRLQETRGTLNKKKKLVVSDDISLQLQLSPFTLRQTKQQKELLSRLGANRTVNVSEHTNRKCEVALFSTSLSYSYRATSKQAGFLWVIWDHLGNTCTQFRSTNTNTHTAGFGRKERYSVGTFLSSLSACVTA